MRWYEKLLILMGLYPFVFIVAITLLLYVIFI
jgi:hypothetical protein